MDHTTWVRKPKPQRRELKPKPVKKKNQVRVSSLSGGLKEDLQKTNIIKMLWRDTAAALTLPATSFPSPLMNAWHQEMRYQLLPQTKWSHTKRLSRSFITLLSSRRSFSCRFSTRSMPGSWKRANTTSSLESTKIHCSLELSSPPSSFRWPLWKSEGSLPRPLLWTWSRTSHAWFLEQESYCGASSSRILTQRNSSSGIWMNLKMHLLNLESQFPQPWRDKRHPPWSDYKYLILTP